ncbi:LysM domain-containing protein [Phanerochaete sordida]|uniref:LysM domain-containing protein n=1 Tax=Phanerochaete sordida TaxID=48140 RepID=A0A9P3GM88_9APHY|nr:LysM domain-containing protein [Phanerochaete sordida]
MFVLAPLATLAALFLTVHAQLPPDCARTTIVQSDDTCNSISATQHVSTFQLAHVNPGINAACSNLQKGQTLCLGVAGQDCSTVDVVSNGDSCATIAGGAGISVSTLLHNNPNVDPACDNIGIGEVLCTANVLFDYT